MKKLYTATWFYDNEQEFEEAYMELQNNPDFTHLGGFDMVQDIYEELNYQGFSDDEITQLTNNRYGNCLEILEEPNNQYQAFIGAR